MERYKLQEIAHDPWNATQFVNELQRYFPVEKIIEHRQGAQSYNEPMKALERMIYRAEFLVGPNPILTWECANIVATTDSNLNIKPDKKKSIQKIDGMCALIMALGRAVVHYKPMAASVYETRGFREL